MKTLSPTSTVTGPQRSPCDPDAVADPSSFVPVAPTRTLLAGSLAARMARLESDDMLSTDGAADLVGTTRVTINAWIAKGRAIGLTQTRRGFKLPSWQFEPAVWEAVPQLSRALGTREGWALLTFLETPLGALDGRTPRQAIEQGHAARVVALAGVEGS
ncbi:DUF3046 domain-containing protein [Comamonas endophytica]|uniref:DUF3046 domain-containing protein n=1 Tax=Comamonas endophytica TaxID=2949090 RepID=A0ABY6GG93_9BURK|nr:MULTISPECIES: DUF3046 domain-containing protein [unclassified Acidovorax]MCD2513342.1 DUF3046 domain-containing protein [Acidovorax sp. D4N7]UYG53873.1 DUF3046 domain-containing protein [Acidovorax sp. 5MLIR]